MIDRTLWQRLLLIGSILFVAGGCARVDRLPPEPVAPVETPEEARTAPDQAQPAPDELLLEQATAHFEAGRLQQAANLNRQLLEMEGVPSTRRERALWSQAMIHLLPESPLHDPSRARTNLTRLGNEHGESVRGQQARWLLGLLDEMDQLRGQMAEQTELLEQLTETVEQLRRIDLNRRPSSGGGPGRPESSRPPQ